MLGLLMSLSLIYPLAMLVRGVVEVWDPQCRLRIAKTLSCRPGHLFSTVLLVQEKETRARETM